jgi:hydrogenase/urease accessory protein HupE
VRSERLVVLAVLGLLQAPAADAHTVGLSRGEYRVAGAEVEVDLVFARTELAAAVPAVDADRDRLVSEGELARASGAIEETIVRGLRLRTAAGACGGRLAAAALAEEDGVVVKARYRCPGGAVPLAVQAGFLDALSLGHRHIAAARAGDETVRAVVYESRPGFEIGASASRAPSPRAAAWPLFKLGVEHILTGYDHLVFLLALVLVGGRLRPLLLVVTAFTVAHSMTLAAAVLGVWAPDARFVEPAIALSIVYVGIENLFVRDTRRRWLVAFPFGLVHGFGFAGALGEIALPAADVPLALASFNAGVEAGQVAVLMMALPVVRWLGGRRWFAGYGVHALSVAVATAGAAWFLARVAG